MECPWACEWLLIAAQQFNWFSKPHTSLHWLHLTKGGSLWPIETGGREWCGYGNSRLLNRWAATLRFDKSAINQLPRSMRSHQTVACYFGNQSFANVWRFQHFPEPLASFVVWEEHFGSTINLNRTHGKRPTCIEFHGKQIKEEEKRKKKFCWFASDRSLFQFSSFSLCLTGARARAYASSFALSLLRSNTASVK